MATELLFSKELKYGKRVVRALTRASGVTDEAKSQTFHSGLDIQASYTNTYAVTVTERQEITRLSTNVVPID